MLSGSRVCAVCPKDFYGPDGIYCFPCPNTKVSKGMMCTQYVNVTNENKVQVRMSQ